MKKVLFVIDSLISGGAEKSLVTLLNLFDYQKYEVDLLMFSPKGLYLPLLPKEVNILEEPSFIKHWKSDFKILLKNMKFKELYIKFGASASLRNPFYSSNMHSAQLIWKWLTKGTDTLDKKYDVAIAYSQGMPTYFVAEKVKADKKLTWVNIDYKIASYNKHFDIEFYKKFDKIVAVSDSCKKVLIEEIPLVKSKINVIYDIISPSLIKSMAVEGEGFKDSFDGLRILTIGRLAYQKGYEMAIEACYKLKQKGINFKWYAIGEGILKSKLETMIKEYGLEDTFILLGTFTNPYAFLKQCDLYVQPSRFEGYGLAIAEARILRKPIVATNFTVVHNQIRNNENGVIVEMNSDALYSGITKIIEDGKLRNAIFSNLEKDNAGTEDEIFNIYSLIER